MFALGLSMGGMTTYHLSLRNPNLFEGTILMAPALKNAVGGFTVGVLSALKKIMPDSLKLMKPMSGIATRNPTVTK